MYAETTRAHIEDTPFDTGQAVRDTIRMAHTRVKAYGYGWKKWYIKQRGWRDATTRTIPIEHQNYRLTQCDEEGNYDISDELVKLYDKCVRGKHLKQT